MNKNSRAGRAEPHKNDDCSWQRSDQFVLLPLKKMI
jgi:hypothetical protein